MTERIIIGIDPGTNVMGYGILGINGKKPHMIAMGVLEAEQVRGPLHAPAPHPPGVLGLIAQYLPDGNGYRSPVFGKNVQSMLKLGRAKVWQNGGCTEPRHTYYGIRTEEDKDGHNRHRRRFERAGTGNARRIPHNP